LIRKPWMSVGLMVRILSRFYKRVGIARLPKGLHKKSPAENSRALSAGVGGICTRCRRADLSQKTDTTIVSTQI